MKPAIKVFFLALGIGLIFAVAFGIWGSRFELLFSQQACTKWFHEIRPWAWIVGIGLLMADLVLPIPATGIMAALGNVYGVWMGGLLSTIGSIGAGFSGYGLARLAGKRGARLLASDDELARFKTFFDRWGGWGIVASRLLPILPEALTILAGLARMGLKRFSAALLMGTIPTCFLFSFLGEASKSAPGFGIATAAVLPLLLWPFFLWLFRKGLGESAPSKKPLKC